tara:strand:+ start:3207 stop:3983 length:777 start_codon:yes stop_codon:yes gene_type:complete
MDRKFPSNGVVNVPGGVVIRADLFGASSWITHCDRAALAVADPPYGRIVSEKWDQVDAFDLAELLGDLSSTLSLVMLPGAHFCLWGGFGAPGNRAFYCAILEIEARQAWQMAAHNTWRKKRAYGTAWRCLAAREEMARFVLGDIKKPRVFNVPLTDARRGYVGFNSKHPAKSDFKRLTMVWDHASDMGQNKPHKCHKPEPLARTQIEMCTDPGDLVLDLFAGSGQISITARALDRPFIAIENDPETFDALVERIRSCV